jgi:predicted RecB family nuclease
MTFAITSEIVESYSLCPRKAFLLLWDKVERDPHEYASLVEEQAAENRKTYRNTLLETTSAVVSRGPLDPSGDREIIVDVLLSLDGLEARCDAVRWARETSAPGKRKNGYEPAMVVGTHRVAKSQVIALAYLGHVLGQLQHHVPIAGTIVRADGQACRLNLTAKYQQVKSIVAVLKAWTKDPSDEAPPVILNKHCPSCPFRGPCYRQAETEDNLSLLDRMSPRIMKKYRATGIFTVNQLSYLFQPRRTKKRGRRPVRHNLELQALALRTKKTYVEQLPDLSRREVELFVDVEGIPDRGSHYLIGLLACENGETRYHSFWANGVVEEGRIWQSFLDRVAEFPDAPLYHYGSYERKAFESLAKRYGKGQEVVGRLVNVIASIYGKIYSPVRSNGLKALGSFLGATWTAPEASGLQSLVWRHRWEMTGADQYMHALLQYNREDCEALRLVAHALCSIKEKADSEPSIDFIDHPKQDATEIGRVVHRQFEQILKYAEAGSGKKVNRFRLKDAEQADGPKKKGPLKGHQGFHRIIPAKAARTIRVASKKRCPRHHVPLVSEQEKPAEKTVIDLVFNRNGCRKTIVTYVGTKAYCPKCTYHYSPPSFDRLYRSSFGHGFQVWTIYQRIILRLPYRIITQVMEHLFGVGMSQATVVNFLRYVASYYKVTEAAILRAMLKSEVVHVDETRINIQGVDHYVWVFTDGRHVSFRMTETREADIVHQVLSGYQGVLVSDFYPGYDSVPCKQQKCLVHLIRDLNDDLWKAPFDREFEALVLEIRTLLVPILGAIDRYGLKAWHLRKFEESVERFYARNIVNKEYGSELAAKYQKRFQRCRESLFTFLGQDSIPWNNNMAERAIRQLATQRKISGTFFKKVAPQYLLLLAIAQTCRFQEKSFLKFLLSKERDVDQFRRSRPIKYSAPVDQRENPKSPSLHDDPVQDGTHCPPNSRLHPTAPLPS